MDLGRTVMRRCLKKLVDDIMMQMVHGVFDFEFPSSCTILVYTCRWSVKTIHPSALRTTTPKCP